MAQNLTGKHPGDRINVNGEFYTVTAKGPVNEHIPRRTFLEAVSDCGGFRIYTEF